MEQGEEEEEEEEAKQDQLRWKAEEAIKAEFVILVHNHDQFKFTCPNAAQCYEAKRGHTCHGFKDFATFINEKVSANPKQDYDKFRIYGLAKIYKINPALYMKCGGRGSKGLHILSWFSHEDFRANGTGCTFYFNEQRIYHVIGNRWITKKRLLHYVSLFNMGKIQKSDFAKSERAVIDTHCKEFIQRPSFIKEHGMIQPNLEKLIDSIVPYKDLEE